MVTPFIAGNWKMNTLLPEAIALAKQLRGPLSAIPNVRAVVCPPYVSLAAVSEVLNGSSIGIGAQDLHPTQNGAFTGAISGPMLHSLCQYVIVGHSERRQIFGDSDAIVNKKVLAAIESGLVPILCVGETFEEREMGATEHVVSNQVRIALTGAKTEAPNLVLAYEPVWAIGTGQPAKPEEAQNIMNLLRQVLEGDFGREFASKTPLLYGGSITPTNIPDFMAEQDIDGALVGGASLKAAEFISIVQIASQVNSNGSSTMGNHGLHPVN